MSVLLDPNNTRVWPSKGAGPDVFHDDTRETPSASEPFSIESLAHSAISSVPDVGEAEKTAALAAAPADRVPLTLQNIWRHSQAHPIALTLLLLDKYGEEYVTWDPEALKLTLERDGIKVSNESWNKILASRVLLNSPSPWRQWEVFHWVCLALCGHSPNFVYLEEPELTHLVVGAHILHVIDPKRVTSHEVDKYVAASFRSEGIVYIPEPLSFGQRELEESKLECTSCGGLHRDDNDVRCVSCGKAALKKVVFEFADLRDRTKELFEPRKRLPLDKAVDNLPDSGVGNAVYRLLVEWDYAHTVQAQMIQQLRMIGRR